MSSRRGGGYGVEISAEAKVVSRSLVVKELGIVNENNITKSNL